MTGADIISIAITLFAIAAGALFTSVHISALSTADNKGLGGLNRRTDDLLDLIRAESARTHSKLDTILKRLADLDTRFTRLEERNP